METKAESKQLYEFQEEGVNRVIKAPKNRLVLNYATGLGKTITACSVLARLNARRVLIVCPAMVKQTWLDALDEWYPAHAKAAAITVGKDRIKGLSKKALKEKDDAYSAEIQIVSYGLVGDILRESWDFIILDESHRLKNPAARQTRAVRAILLQNPNAGVLELTATLFPDRITDIWSQLDLLWPGRFGRTSPTYKYPSYWFCKRYSLDIGDEYGVKWAGINPVHEAELRRRVAEVSHRVTKHEVAHLLPSFIVSLIKVKAKSTLFDNIDHWLESQGSIKIPFVLEWVSDAIEDANHICILTHLRETAEQIGHQTSVDTNWPVFVIDGSMPPEARNARLAEAKKAPKSIIVATMHSIGIGINLGFCSRVLFAELYWRPETIIQALGRFDGFRTLEPTSADLLCIEGTEDEAMARMLLKKIDAMNRALKAGIIEEKLESVLGGVKMSDEEAIASLNATLFQTTDGAYD